MSHDNYGKNPQEAAVRAAASILDFGMFCMNRYVEECSNMLKLSNYFSNSYAEIFYGKGMQAERLFVKPMVEIGIAAETAAPVVTIPIHDIEGETYGEKKAEAPLGKISPMLKN
jgi:hypothetical protein